MNNNSKEFKKLQEKWYKKLEKQGFDDIENSYGEIKSGPNNNARYRYSPDKTISMMESKTEYYRLAGQFLYDHTFENLFDKLVWSAHCEGTTIREIAKAMYTYKRKVNDSILKNKLLMLKKYKDQKND